MVKLLSRMAETIFPSHARAAGAREAMESIELRERKQRIAGHDLAAQYIRHFLGATEGRRRPDWYAQTMHADVEMQAIIPTLRSRSRLMVDNESKASGLIHKEITNTLGPGFSAQAWVPRSFSAEVAPDDAANEKLTSTAEAYWKERIDVSDNKDLDWKRERTILQLLQLMYRHFRVDGELFLRFYVVTGRSLPFMLQIIESECVGTPNGMETDPNIRFGKRYSPDTGELLGFYVAKAHPGSLTAISTAYEFVPVRNELGLPNMLHFFAPHRETASRGLPWLHRVLVPINDIGDYKDSELQRKRVEADIALLIGLENPDKFASAMQSDGGFGASPTSGPSTRSTDARSWDTRGRKVMYMNQNETATVVDPQRPGNTYEPFCNSIDRDIGNGVGRSFERVANNYGAANFSATRVSGIEDFVEHETEFRLFSGTVLSPIWTWAMWALAFEIGNVAYRAVRAEFQRYVKPSWDGKNDAEAGKVRIESGSSSIVEECAIQGRDWETVQDNRLRAEKREREQRVAMKLPEPADQVPTIDKAIDGKVKKAVGDGQMMGEGK